MKAIQPSKSFNYNIFFWKIFGLWNGRTTPTYYKIYSFFYLMITLFIYNLFLSINLYYTPRKIQNLIAEVIFYFNEVSITIKVLTIILMKDYIVQAFDTLDCEKFKATVTEDQKKVQNNIRNYKIYWKFYSMFAHTAFLAQVVIPVIMYLVFSSNLALPVSNYNFLSDEIKEKYFVLLYIYQGIGIYGHMNYNINVDSFIAGMLMMAITQVKVIQQKLERLKLEKNEIKMSPETQEGIQMGKLNSILIHYSVLLKFCKLIQTIISFVMFAQFGLTSAIVCIVLCGLLLPFPIETKVFLVIYLFCMMSQIFVPSWLGAILSVESQKLAVSAYKSEWIPRSISFKQSIKLFVERVNKPIIMTGTNMFPLSLGTFISIMKTAYSFFTLVRNVQDRQT